MPIAAIIEHGVKPNYDVLDETGVLVKSLSIKPTRESVERKGGQRLVVYVREENPMMTLDFKGSIIADSNGAAVGFANQHPGTTVTSLANFTGDIHGFNPSDGKIIYKDPVRDLSDGEEEPQISFTAKQYPGIAAA